MNKERKTPSLKSLEKALCVLDFIGEKGTPKTAKEISSGVSISISSAYKILTTLVGADYLTYDALGKHYALSSKFIRFSGRMREVRTLGGLIRPYMLEIADLTHETVHFGVVEGFYGVFMEKVNSSHVIGVQTRIGTKYPLDRGATAKILMAFMDEEKFEDFCNDFLDDGSDSGLSRIEAAREKREEIRKQGFAATSEEVNPDVSAVAAPILGYGKSLIGSLAIAGPCERFTSEKVEEYTRLVIAYAKKISLVLGAADD